MPSTPSRGYTYPTTSSPATVPADLRVPLEQIDADVQTLTDQLEGAVRLEEDGSLPEAVESRVEAIAREFGSPAGAIPIFATLAEAQAWEYENPGRVALTIEAPADPSAWPAAAVVFDYAARTYTIPADQGAVYQVDGVTQLPGEYPVGKSAVTLVVSAVAKPGYTLAGTTEWSGTFPDASLAGTVVMTDTVTAAAADTGQTYYDPSVRDLANGWIELSSAKSTGVEPSPTFMPNQDIEFDYTNVADGGIVIYYWGLNSETGTRRGLFIQASSLSAFGGGSPAVQTLASTTRTQGTTYRMRCEIRDLEVTVYQDNVAAVRFTYTQETFDALTSPTWLQFRSYNGTHRIDNIIVTRFDWAGS